MRWGGTVFIMNTVPLFNKEMYRVSANHIYDEEKGYSLRHQIAKRVIHLWIINN